MGFGVFRCWVCFVDIFQLLVCCCQVNGSWNGGGRLLPCNVWPYRLFQFALIAIAVLCWIGGLTAGIREEEAYKPIIIRNVNIVKEGAYADSVIASSIPSPVAKYGEFKLDVTVAYLKPFVGPESVTVKDISILTNGFELENVEPPLPFNIGSSSITFTLTIKGPQEGFEGPLTLKITLSS